jgi:GrpB-like predicted nucleotidyltransferase (UPF0157 family)
MPNMSFQPAAVFQARANALVARETARILARIPAAEVEHIGGTAIAGALTKGDVDVLVTIPARDFERAVRILSELYAVNQPENWTATFASFKDDASFELPFGAQLAARGCESYGFIQLRDRLNSDPAALARYNAIKLANEGQDAAKYRETKGEFVERLLES